MIKRINHIKDFGVFKNYQRSGETQDFMKLNIIYGWNYSGKTTISRIFQSFENQKLDSNYSAAEFEIEDYDKNKFNQTKLNQNTHEFKIFNSDFVRENIHLGGEVFDPILLLGKESKDAVEKIKVKSARLQKVNKISVQHSKKVSAIDKSLSDGLKRLAATITEKLEIVQAFDKRHVEPIFKKLNSHYNPHILPSKKVKELLVWATSDEKDKLEEIEEYKPSISLENQIESSKNLLNKTPEFSQTIDYFLNNKEASDWVELGLDINDGKTKCEFCRNDISEERTKELLAHFSKDLKSHKELLLALKVEVEKVKIKNPKQQKSDFYQDLWLEFDLCQNEIQDAVTKYNDEIENLIAIIQQKYDAPFVPISDYSSINSDSSILDGCITKYNKLVAKHNKKSIEFKKNKDNAIESLKNHYVATFIISYKPKDKNELKKWYESRKSVFERKSSILIQEIADLESSISKAQVGAKQLNLYIEKFLGRKEIKVTVVADEGNERFKLVRGKKKP